MGEPTVAEALAQARAAGVDRLDAQQLIAHRLARPRAWLLAHDDEPLPPAVAQGWAADLADLADDVPLAYLLGEQDFHGLALEVSADVLVPRADTATLVDWAIERLAGHAAPEMVDLGTGSGAIALAVARAVPQARIVATDASVAALVVAEANARRHALALECRAGPWWQAVGERRFDLAVSNPPYIAADDPHLRALRHEPTHALVSGADGLDAIRAIVAGAPARLNPGGWLLLEHGWTQGPVVRALLAATGFDAIENRLDLAGRWRCTGGRHP